jgi:Photosynthesis system II assembly factor YCF48
VIQSPAGRAASPAVTAAPSSATESPSASTARTNATTPTAGRCPAAFQSQAAGYFNGIQFVSPERGWAVGQREILATGNGGRRWTVQDTGNLGLTSVDFISAQDGWAVGVNSVLATTDGGAHWTALADPCIRSVHFVSPQTGFAIAGGTGSRTSSPAPADGGRVLTTSDGGQSWRPLPAPTDAQTVCFDNAEQGWLGAAGRLYRSADGGRSWTLVTAGAKPVTARYAATMVVQCAGAGAAWALDVGPGVEASRQPQIGYYASASGAVPLFAEQDSANPVVSVTAEPPGSDAGPISAISPASAVFIGFCPACGPETVPWDLITASGTSITREGIVGGQLTQPESASFLSARLGWVLGVVTRYRVGARLRQFQRIVRTSDGGRSWQVLYTS